MTVFPNGMRIREKSYGTGQSGRWRGSEETWIGNILKVKKDSCSSTQFSPKSQV